MKILICTFLYMTTILTTSFAGAAKSPVQSKEEIEFMDKREEKMVGLLKTSDFAGVITRTGEAYSDLRLVDLYRFKNVSDVSMSKKLCTQLLAKIFGPLKEISLKVRAVDIYRSHTGSTCEAQIDNEDSLAKIPERRVILGFIKAQPYGIVFKFSKKSTSTEQADVKKFWESLR